MPPGPPPWHARSALSSAASRVAYIAGPLLFKELGGTRPSEGGAAMDCEKGDDHVSLRAGEAQEA